jgi:hypothetical protein
MLLLTVTIDRYVINIVQIIFKHEEYFILFLNRLVEMATLLNSLYNFRFND